MLGNEYSVSTDVHIHNPTCTCDTFTHPLHACAVVKAVQRPPTPNTHTHTPPHPSGNKMQMQYGKNMELQLKPVVLRSCEVGVENAVPKKATRTKNSNKKKRRLKKTCGTETIYDASIPCCITLA